MEYTYEVLKKIKWIINGQPTMDKWDEMTMILKDNNL